MFVLTLVMRKVEAKLSFSSEDFLTEQINLIQKEDLQ